jgi:hypothetical protein
MQGPKETNPVYDTNGSNANRGQPGESNVMFLAGTFDRMNQEFGKITRKITTDSNTSILAAGVTSNASIQEHHQVFSPGTSNAQVMAKVDEIISDAACSIRIETGGSSVDFTTGGSALLAPVRIQGDDMHTFFPGQGIVHSNSGSELNFMYSAIDGYWVFLKPLSPGQYTITIHGDAPWLGGKKDEPRFETDVRYEITVVSAPPSA